MSCADQRDNLDHQDGRLAAWATRQDLGVTATVEYVEAALRAQDRRLVVVKERELDDDLVGDGSEVLTSMCALLYGRRSARRPAEHALVVAAGEAA